MGTYGKMASEFLLSGIFNISELQKVRNVRAITKIITQISIANFGKME